MRHAARKLRLKGKELLSRLTGLSLPIFGVSWNAPKNERDVSGRLLEFLADRRALFQPYDCEIGGYVNESILKIRERLVVECENSSKDTPLGTSVRAVAAACREFLTVTQLDRHHHLDREFLIELGKLRTLFGIQIAIIACAYDLEVPETLAAILPPDVGEEK